MAAKNTTSGATGQSSGRDTLAKLRLHVADVQTRLKRADSATNRSVKALQTAFDTLKNQSGADGEKLQQHVNHLAAKLTAMAEQTRGEVKADLQAALDMPRLDTITAAVNQANDKLTQGEIRQAEAIQKINQQIARLASALDARLQTETREREALGSKLSERIDAISNSQNDRLHDIEQQTANAVTDIGTRIVALSDELSKKVDASEERAGERAAEIALDTQHNLEYQRAETEQRIGDITDRLDGELTPLQRQLATLAARVDAMESGMSGMVAQAPIDALPPFPAFDVTSQTSASPIQADSMPAAFTANLLENDAFSPEPAPIANTAVVPPANVPQAQPIPEPNIPPPAAIPPSFQPSMQPNIAVNGGPVEFDPSQYPQVDYGLSASATEQLSPNSALTPLVAPPPPADMLPAQNYESPVNPYAAPPQDDSIFALNAQSPQPYSDNPYNAANPALNAAPYAALENVEQDSMEAARPGAPIGASKRASFLTKRTLRTGASTAALVTVVALGGLMVKNKLVSDTPARSPAPLTVSNTLSSAPNQEESVHNTNLEINIAEPTGKMAGPEGVTSGLPAIHITQPDTLDAALAAGHPIAQFQKGLTLLESGDETGAASFIRKAAAQNQPAAQYYLGHMYENGQGVKQDSVQARKLTEQAAKGGHRIAMYDLALYYIEGKGGVDISMETAASWFRKAADYGMVDAQYNLAVLHERGTGVPVDMAESYVWFAIAGQNGDQDSATRADFLKDQLSGDALGRAEAKIAGFKPAEVNEHANGIFKDLAWNTVAKGPDERVVVVQQMLGNLGYEAGVADGAMGPKTREAIKAFERANNLPETGQINNELVQRLSTASGA